ncbi:MAG TPA: hypothetical protein VFI23_12990 [Rhizomicrobium sp.]|nr:hypothetical protein [Rhizomicrobium sp.]
MRKSVIWIGVGVALAIAAAVLVLQGADNKGTRLALELTARWSFLLFWLAYAGNAVAALFGVSGMAGRAREFGLAFAAAHLVHIGLIFRLGVILGRVPLSGGLLLFFLIALFATYLLAGLSFGGAKALGAAWPPLRFVAMNYILIAFGRDFLLPVLYPKPAQYNVGHFLFYAPFLLLSLAAPLLVLAASMRRAAPR